MKNISWTRVFVFSILGSFLLFALTISSAHAEEKEEHAVPEYSCTPEMRQKFIDVFKQLNLPQEVQDQAVIAKCGPEKKEKPKEIPKAKKKTISLSAAQIA